MLKSFMHQLPETYKDSVRVGDLEREKRRA